MSKHCEPTPGPRKLTAAQAAKLNEQLAEDKRLAEEWVAAFHRLPPLAQNHVYNALMDDTSTAFGRLSQIVQMFIQRACVHAEKECRRLHGPELKKRRVEERHCRIDVLLDQGFTDPQAIRDHLRDHYPELVRKGRGKPPRWIDPRLMMRTYRRSRNAGKNCNSSD